MALQDEVDALVQQARLVGTDTMAVEIKKAEGGAPKTLPESVSAFANGGGGIIILGLDEANGVPIVAASVPPCDFKLRPCFVKTQGMEHGSYIRAHDGDRHLTTYEIHLLVDGRGQPQDDIEPVEGATMADLAKDAVDALVERFRTTRGPGFSQAPTADILRMAGVCPRGDTPGRITLAGLMTLGTYPQEFFPQLNVTFVSYPTSDGRPMADGTRFLENVAIDGPIPQMVSRLVEVVTRSMTRRSVMVGIGREDVWEYPIEVVRELAVNALMHRDYHPLANGTQVRVEMFLDRLVFINPGGFCTVWPIRRNSATAGPPHRATPTWPVCWRM